MDFIQMPVSQVYKYLLVMIDTHSSVLAWRIPGMGEPGGLLSMGHTEADTTEAT